MLASKSKDNQDIIYLTGYEAVKIILLKENYKSYDVLYQINEKFCNIFQIIELFCEKNLLYLNSLEEINLITFENNIYNNTNKTQLDVSNILIKEEDKNKPILSLNKISDDIISISISNTNEQLELKQNSLSFSELDCLTLISSNSSNSSSNDTEEKNFHRIIYKIGKYKENQSNNKNNIIILKEYKIPSNYDLLGILSEEDNLFLMSFKSENEKNFDPHICIFDFSICQYIKSFKFHNNFTYPKLFIKNHFESKKDGFIICDENLNLTQYFYDKDLKDKIYYVKTVEAQKKMYNIPIKLISLKQSIFIFCNHNNYYIFSE